MRERADLSQAEVARRAGVTRGALHLLEKGLEAGGTAVLSAEAMLAVASILNVDAWWLVTGRGSPKVQPRLDPLELDLIAHFRALDTQQRHVLVSLASQLSGGEQRRL